MKDIRDFVEIHERMQGAPPDLPACLQEVWKKLQRFSMDDPLSFYELAISLRAMFTYSRAHKHLEEDRDGQRRPALVVPLSPWRERIVAQGFASQGEGDAVQHFEVHEVVQALFQEHLIPKPTPPKQEPPPPAATAAKPVQVANFTLVKKRTRGKKKK